MLDPAPHDIDAEQAFLGALLFDNRIGEATEWLAVDHFYDPVHARIFSRAIALIERGQIADPVVINNALANDAGLKEVGGATYLAVLVESAAVGPAAIEYARIVKEQADKRRLMELGRLLVGSASNASVPSSELVELTEAELSALADQEEGENEVGLAEALSAALATPTTYVETGLVEFDEDRVLAPGLIILGGRSSMGKSALMLALCHAAAKRGQACLIPSNEMPASQIALRIAAIETGVPYVAALSGRVTAGERKRLDRVIAELGELPITILEVPGVGISGLRSRIRRWKRAQIKASRKLGLVGLDYLQNIPGKGGSLYEKTSDVAHGLQSIQLSSGLCLVVGCQLGRAAESEKDKRPSLRHLRDSGKIEEVADKVLLVYRDAYYAEREPIQDDVAAEIRRKERALSKVVEIDLAKNRQGPLKKFELIADMSLNKFEDMC